MLENWTWDPRVLARLSSHWETGKPLPADLIARKVEAKTAFEAVGTVAQLFQSTFDLILHSPDASGDKKDANGIVAKERKAIHKKHAENDSQAMWGTLKLDMMDMQMLPETNPAASFDHLFGGYESQYYGYLWSQVYSCDAFAKFEEIGIMNAELGRKYRDIILAPGGSRDTIDALKDFLGREPNDEAFLRMNGFVEA